MHKEVQKKKQAVRECISCGARQPKALMLRITCGGEGEYDPTGRQKGRGAYLCRKKSCMDKAVKSGLITAETAKGLAEAIHVRRFDMLGLGVRAGKVVSGEVQAENAIAGGTAMLCILAEDASPNTRKKFRNKCVFRKVPLIECGTVESLGKAVGKGERSVVCVTDEAFAAMIRSRLTEDEE